MIGNQLLPLVSCVSLPSSGSANKFSLSACSLCTYRLQVVCFSQRFCSSPDDAPWDGMDHAGRGEIVGLISVDIVGWHDL